MNAIAPAVATAERLSTSDRFQRYYEEAGPDYAAWSPGFNMHFGFFRSGMNPLRREAMLEQMNREVLDRLQADRISSPRLLDMGCGLGATLRSFACRRPSAQLTGITLSPWQFEQGTRLNRQGPEGSSIRILVGDYENTSQPSESFDGICAIESSCYASGANKSAFLREAHRLLRPGGRLVVADGFIGGASCAGWQKAVYRRLCECWVIDDLGEIDPFAAELERTGFRNVAIEQVQARVTPSVLHVPWVTLRFLFSTAMSHRRMTRARWNNVLAPLLLPLVGYPLGPLAYYIISATRI